MARALALWAPGGRRARYVCVLAIHCAVISVLIALGSWGLQRCAVEYHCQATDVNIRIGNDPLCQ